MKTALDKHVRTFLDNNKDFVIFGDFNMEFNQHANDHCKWIERTFECKQVIHETTTDYGTVLDLVFTNMIGLAGVLKTFWSDHKIIYFGSTLHA